MQNTYCYEFRVAILRYNLIKSIDDSVYDPYLTFSIYIVLSHNDLIKTLVFLNEKKYAKDDNILHNIS